MGPVRGFARAVRCRRDGFRWRYLPERYWERRASELIASYDEPTTWQARDWNIVASPEAALVPQLIEEHRIKSVLVAGAGSGRQYSYLTPLAVDIRGFDISPTMVATCRSRYPGIETICGNVIGSDRRQQPADLVLSVTVLQHVPSAEIEIALMSLRNLTSRLLVLMELTAFDAPPAYVFVHDYRTLMASWELVAAVDVPNQHRHKTEVLVWARPEQR